MEVGAIKHRRPWLAALLSFVNTGWGQFYVGRWRRGLVLLGIDVALGALLVFNMGTFLGLLLGGMVLISFNLYVAVDAYLGARGAGEYRLLPCNRWWVYGLLLAFSLGMGTALDSAEHKTYKIPSGSMLQTLQVGDHLMAELLDEDAPVRRGDILILKYPVHRDKDFIKRVVALPGETIEIRQRAVFIDGRPLEEPYVFVGPQEYLPSRDEFGPFTVPDNHYFVMGDNRNGSHDSRFVGPIVRKDILARARYLYYPGDGDWSRWGKAVR